MKELIDSMPSWMPVAAAALVILVLLLIALLSRRQGSVAMQLRKSLGRISYDVLSGIVVPKSDEGEIQIDYVLLTARGILIVELKEVEGVVFGSDRMQDWTVIHGDRRYTFANPQAPMFDRVAAVRRIVRDVPVDGCILFADIAQFTKGVPGHVTDIRQLLGAYPRIDRKRPPAEINAFFPQWERLRQEAVSAQVSRLVHG